MTRRSRSSAGVVGQSLPVSRVAVSASFQEDSWEVIVGHEGQGSSETYRSRVFGGGVEPQCVDRRQTGKYPVFVARSAFTGGGVGSV